VHGQQASQAHEAAETQESATEVDGFGEQSRRVGQEWRRVDDEHRAALVRELFDDLASLRPPRKRRR
jgi:hypothetical protein